MPYLFRHEQLTKKNYRSVWQRWCSIAPTQTLLFVEQINRTEKTMPSAIRRMKLLEAFDEVDSEGEIRMVEIAQMLAERFPKLMALQEDGSANDSSQNLSKQFWPPMVGKVLMM